jgi:hypothetical protein
VTIRHSLKAYIIPLLLAAVPVHTAGGEQPSNGDCDDTCGWPTRGDPGALLQARRCTARPAEETLSLSAGTLVTADDLPVCLRPAFAALAAGLAEVAGEPIERAVARVRIGHYYYEGSAYYQPRGRKVVYLPAQIDPIMDALQQEWPEYESASGDLGWSGFLLVIDGNDLRVRLIGDEPRPGDIWLHSERIIDEFFPGLPTQPVSREN